MMKKRGISKQQIIIISGHSKKSHALKNQNSQTKKSQFWLPRTKNTSTEWNGRKIPENQTPQIWYSAIADCDNILSKYKFKASNIKVEVNFKNKDSHFSVENIGLKQLHLLQMIITMSIMGFIYGRISKIKKREEEYDSIHLFIFASLGCDLVSELLLCINLQVYDYDGEGIFIASYFGQFLSQSAQYIISYMLILLATGYTIDSKNLQHPEFYMPIGAILVVVQVIIVGISKLADDSYNKYHDYSGMAGFFLLLFQMSLLTWFMVNLYYYKKQKKDGPSLFFINRLRIFGSIYFLVFPMLLIFGDFFVEEYLRHKIITIGTTLFQHISMLMMTYAFGIKRGTYQMISQRGKGLII